LDIFVIRVIAVVIALLRCIIQNPEELTVLGADCAMHWVNTKYKSDPCSKELAGQGKNW